MNETSATGEKTESRLSSAFVKIGTAVASAFAVKKIVDFGAELVKTSAAASDNIDKMSQKIGVSRQAYQELDFILSQSGASVDSLQTGMKTMVSQMTSSAETFGKLGISVVDSTGNLRSSEDVMWETLVALQSMDNETEKAALATKLFGRAGTELMPLLNGSAGSIEEMRQQAHELGIVLDDEAIDAGVAYTDATDKLNRQVKTLKNSLGAALLPALTKLIDKITPLMARIMPKLEKAFGKVVDAVEPFVEMLADALANAIEWMIDHSDQTLGIIEAVGVAIGVIMVALNPIPAAIAAVVAAIVYLGSNWENVWSTVQDFMRNLPAKMEELGRKAYEAVRGWLMAKFNIDMPEWETVKTNITNWWNGVKEKADNIIRAVFGIKDGDTWENVKQKFSDWWTGVKSKATEIICAVFGIKGGLSWEEVKSKFDDWWTSTKELVKGVFQAVFGIKGGMTWSEVRQKFDGWWKGIKTRVTDVFKAIFGIQGGLTWPKVKQKFDDWWTGIKTNVTNIFMAIFGIGGGKSWQEVKQKFDDWWATTSENATGIFQAVFGIKGGETWARVKKTFEDWWTSRKDLVKELFAAGWKLADGTLKWEDVESIFTKWWKGIETNTVNLFNVVWGLAEPALQPILDEIGEWWNGGGVHGVGVKQQIKDSFKFVFGVDFSQWWNDVQNWWKSVTESSWYKFLTGGTGNGAAGYVGGARVPQEGELYDPYMGYSRDGGKTWEWYANGTDFVERDQQPAILHYGEAVLNRTDAKAWRDGSGTGGMMALADKMDAMIGLLQNGMNSNQQIVLDTGVLVGATVGLIDNQLGTITSRKGRGN